MKRGFIAVGALVLGSVAALAIEPPSDPYFTGRTALNKDYDDMWALHAVGLTAGADSAWRLMPANSAPITVAVVDSGLDWNHLDISWDNIWKNPRETADNGKDDDHNGYIDDIIGWDFVTGTNRPWDYDGHGTFTAGLIAATWNNKAGIAGINPAVKIMVVKVLNDFGNTRASYIAQGIAYAADNGAKIINLSVGGYGTTQIEEDAVRYAVSKGCLVVVAAGNNGAELKYFGLAGLDGVITVGASGHDNQHAVFSNWGKAVDIVAPGVDILSLRARYTDTLRDIAGSTYVAGSAYVGDDKRNYLASGTSFSAPIVSGIASLVWAKDPSLTAEQVKRILLNSAKDVGEPGIDQFTGYGLVDARAALSADKNFYIDTRITGVKVVTGASGAQVQVTGTADSDGFSEAHLEIGAGEKPAAFTPVATPLTAPVKASVLGQIGADKFGGAKVWIVRLVVTHRNGRSREARFRLQLG